MVSEDLKPLFRQAMVRSIFNIHRYIPMEVKRSNGPVNEAGRPGSCPWAPTFKERKYLTGITGNVMILKLCIPSAK